VLDAFEKCRNISEQADNLERFLKHIVEWPPCHFLIAVRKPPAKDEQGELEGYRQAEKLCASHGKSAQMRKIGPMNLSDLMEQDRVLKIIRESLPNPKEWFDKLDRDSVFKCLDGYPLTLTRWMSDAPTSKEEMEEIAADAKSHQNRHLEKALIRIRDKNRDLFKVATRIALLPELRIDTWEAFRPIVLNGIENKNDALADLCTHGVLVHMEPPSFGHTTAYESARRFITEPSDDPSSNLSNYAPVQIKFLIRSCAGKIDTIDQTVVPYSDALIHLGIPAALLLTDETDLGLCAAAVILHAPLPESAEIESKWFDRLLKAANSVATGVLKIPPVFLAAALTNAIGHSDSDFKRADAFLNELRQLDEIHGATDPAVREQFAKGLGLRMIQCLKEKKENEARDANEELKRLYEKYPNDEGELKIWKHVNE